MRLLSVPLSPGRYVVATEANAYWQFRWPWSARRGFQLVRQYKPGEAIILAKRKRNGVLVILAERNA